MSYFLGIDLGTSYFKAGVFDPDGRLCGLGRQPVVKSGGGGGKCELTSSGFWRTLRLAISEAVNNAWIAADDVEALSWSSQANSFILLDRADEPLTPLILWPDERGSTPPDALIQRDDFMDVTGLGIVSGRNAMIAKTEWFRRCEPQLWGRTARVMSISDYLAFILTGHAAGDLGTASMTGLLDTAGRKWWNEAVDTCGISADMLSVPLQTGAPIGRITARGAQQTGLSPHTMLFAGGLDHHIVAVGAGLPCRNYISESTGTVLACVAYQKGYEPRRGVNIAPGLDDARFFQMAFDANGAAALEWYQMEHAPHMTIPQLVELAESVRPGCEGLSAKPCANQYAGLTGFENIEKRHTDGHFTRAILESTARSLADLMQVLRGGCPAEAVVPSGGGARSTLWLQIKADMLGMEFLVTGSGELACKGAAMLCAVGTSCFGSIGEAIGKWSDFKDKITPAGQNT